MEVGAVACFIRTERDILQITQMLDAVALQVGFILNRGITQLWPRLDVEKEKHQNQLELDLKGGLEQVRQSRRQRRDAEIQDLFQSYQTWVRETLELDDTPQFTVVAALSG